MALINNKTIRITLVMLFLLPFVATSQESNLGNWLIYIGNKKLNAKWNIHNEVQYRNYDAVGDLEQLLLRTGLGYNLSENNDNILLGYGYILSENYEPNSDQKVSINEHRIFQQFTTKQNKWRLNITQRYRFEQRFVENDFKMRLRYFLSFNYPLNKKEVIEKTLYLSAYNEVFLNTEPSIFDRNRIYGGLGYKLNKNIKLELGYMSQIFETSFRDQINIIAFINF